MSTNELSQIPSLSSGVIRSERQPGVYYELERCVGQGGMGAAYLAWRKSEEGAASVVVKLLHPEGSSVAPELLAVKEAVALGRLNEQLPPCPFVVRLIDTGTTRLATGRSTHWLAIEYVHGGVEGTTLEDRVTYSLHRTGFGFDPTRAAHLVRCLSIGLGAIHDVAVLHRDLTPGNVLCCGFGETEIFKIADFGVARPVGLAETFAGMRLGTPGYIAPEANDATAGPASDVFSLAAVLYYVLTGQRYFDAENPSQMLAELLAPERKSITEHASLAPELAEQPAACRAIDAALARATHASPAHRLQSARELAQAILPWLGGAESAPRSKQRLLSAVLSSHRPDVALDYRWTVRSRPHDEIVIQSAAWDTDGHALALSPHGAWFWEGQGWRHARELVAPLPAPPSFVQRHAAGGWLLGGRGCPLCVVDQSGLHVALASPTPAWDIVLASGHLGALLAVVEAPPGAAPVLWCATAGRWLRPLPLPDTAQVNALERLDDTRWLVGGRLEGGGFAAVYSPLTWELRFLETPPLRAFIAGASAPERAQAMLVGSGGLTLRLDGDTPSLSRVPGDIDLASAAFDLMDYEWTTSVGQILGRDRRVDAPWRPHWRDPSWRAPFISTMADVGWVLAMTADGAILEGKSDDTALRGRET